MKVSLIIAAGGRGLRFLKHQKKKDRLSKLFLPLAAKPLLCHTLESFRGIPQIREILLALPRGTESWVKTHIVNGFEGPPVRLLRGGNTRAESVRNALQKTSRRYPWIMVHDGARPFPPRKEIMKMLHRCRGGVTPRLAGRQAPGRGNRAPTDCFVLARPVVSTLKRVSSKDKITETVDRSGLFEAETPQLVRRDLLVKAYQKNSKALTATDESSLVESIGGRVKILPHSGWNVKVTTPEDLRFVEKYYFPPSLRTGFGRDTHRLVTGRKFYLGGVRIPFEKGPLGHSDGDALLHAVTDAILGAVGAGDIGDWFSDKDPRHKNIRSEKIVAAVLKEMKRKGSRLHHVDTVIILEKPRLGPYKNKIRKKVAQILGLKEGSVSIKAKTSEGLGPEGQGLAVTCEALVSLS